MSEEADEDRQNAPVPMTLLQVQYVQQGDSVYKVLVPAGNAADEPTDVRAVNPIICQVQNMKQYKEENFLKDDPNLGTFGNLSSKFKTVKSLVRLPLSTPLGTTNQENNSSSSNGNPNLNKPTLEKTNGKPPVIDLEDTGNANVSDMPDGTSFVNSVGASPSDNPDVPDQIMPLITNVTSICEPKSILKSSNSVNVSPESSGPNKIFILKKTADDKLVCETALQAMDVDLDKSIDVSGVKNDVKVITPSFRAPESMKIVNTSASNSIMNSVLKKLPTQYVTTLGEPVTFPVVVSPPRPPKPLVASTTSNIRLQQASSNPTSPGIQHFRPSVVYSSPAQIRKALVSPAVVAKPGTVTKPIIGPKFRFVEKTVSSQSTFLGKDTTQNVTVGLKPTPGIRTVVPVSTVNTTARPYVVFSQGSASMVVPRNTTNYPYVTKLLTAPTSGTVSNAGKQSLPVSSSSSSSTGTSTSTSTSTSTLVKRMPVPSQVKTVVPQQILITSNGQRFLILSQDKSAINYSLLQGLAAASTGKVNPTKQTTVDHPYNIRLNKDGTIQNSNFITNPSGNVPISMQPNKLSAVIKERGLGTSITLSKTMQESMPSPLLKRIKLTADKASGSDSSSSDDYISKLMEPEVVLTEGDFIEKTNPPPSAKSSVNESESSSESSSSSSSKSSKSKISSSSSSSSSSQSSVSADESVPVYEPPKPPIKLKLVQKRKSKGGRKSYAVTRQVPRVPDYTNLIKPCSVRIQRLDMVFADEENEAVEEEEDSTFGNMSDVLKMLQEKQAALEAVRRKLGKT